MEKVEGFEKFKNRLIIEWVVQRGWYNDFGAIKPKTVAKILPPHFMQDFPGLMNPDWTSPTNVDQSKTNQYFPRSGITCLTHIKAHIEALGTKLLVQGNKTDSYCSSYTFIYYPWRKSTILNQMMTDHY